MSGIVGVLRLDGAPIDSDLLQRLTGALAGRGPDGHRSWSDGPVGFGHTRLATRAEADEHQPICLEHSAWIAADARIDGRAELVAQLASAGRGNLGSASDASLILHAYMAWGEDCVTHLLGDFAFAIWDTRTRRLFCARDHFGVKPFYFAHTARNFVFSNSLSVVLQHPDVGDRLNELAVGDFLLFGWNQDPATTIFVDVQRLPGAHRLTCDSGTLRRSRYWSVPADGRVRYQRSRDYVDHFRELLDAAVTDRLPEGPVGMSMSGGLDSTSVAATARRAIARRGSPGPVRAHTVVYDTLFADDERRFASMAAAAIGVKIDFLVADDDAPLEGWDRADLPMPEPSDDPFLRLRSKLLMQAAANCRVLLSGEGADELLWGSYFVDLSKVMPARELAADTARSLLAGVRPPAGIRYAIEQRFRRVVPPPYPPWLNADFTSRLDLRTRWSDVHAASSRGCHPLRPEASGRLASHVWAWYCEASDPGVTGVPIETRYPFLDVRLVSYTLALPPFPWCIAKHVLREAMRGSLPETIRLRRKVPLAGDPLRAWLLTTRAPWLDGFDAAAELADFVDRNAIPVLKGGVDPWLPVRPLCLNAWLKRRKPMHFEEAMLR